MLTVAIDAKDYQVPTVEQLRAAGFVVMLRYRRRRSLQLGREPFRFRYSVMPKGGITTILLLSPDGKWARGKAVCSPHDVFSRRAGYALAIDRALTQLGTLQPNAQMSQEFEAMKQRCLEIYDATPLGASDPETAAYFKRHAPYSGVLFNLWNSKPVDNLIAKLVAKAANSA